LEIVRRFLATYFLGKLKMSRLINEATVILFISLLSGQGIKALDLEQLSKSAGIAKGLYDAIKGQDEKEKGVDALMREARKRGFCEEAQLNALLEYAKGNNDPAVAEWVKSIIRQRDKKEIKRTIHIWGASIIVAQLAIGGMVYCFGNRIIDNLEFREK